MRIARTLPPAAAPIPWGNILRALPAILAGPGTHDEVLEEQVKASFGVEHCFPVSSGKAAFTLVLRALHRLAPKRNEVVVPAFTCYSVPASIHRAGLRVRLCDTAPGSLDFHHDELQRLLAADADSSRILCLVPTDFYGIAADMDGLRSLAGNDMIIVEDAAQSMGESSAAGLLGTRGDVGFFSLGRGKALSCAAGGLILTSRDDIAAALRPRLAELTGVSRQALFRQLAEAALANVLSGPGLYWLPRALPFLHLGETLYEEDFAIRPFSPLQRRLARDWPATLASLRHSRQANVDFFRRRIPPAFRQLAPPDFTGSMIRMPLLAPSAEVRKRVLAASEREGLGIMPGYPEPVHRIAEIAGRFAGQRYANAESLCRTLFTLPTHPRVRAGDRRRIVTLLEEAAGR